MDDKSNSYQKTKEMPPLRELAKKLHPESYGAESESSKAKGKRPEVRDEEAPQPSSLEASVKPTGKRPEAREVETPQSSKAKGKRPEARQEGTQSSKAKGKRPEARDEVTPQSSGLGGGVKPKPSKEGLRHAQLVDYYLLQHHGSKAKQNETDEASVYSATKERAEPLSRKRKSREAEVSHSGDSESRASTAGNGRKDDSYAGNKASAKAKSSGPKKSPAKVSDPPVGSSSGGSKDPSTRLEAGNR